MERPRGSIRKKPSGQSEVVSRGEGLGVGFSDAAWCVTCGAVKLSARSHRSRSGKQGGRKHELRPATPEELQAYMDSVARKKEGPAISQPIVQAGQTQPASSGLHGSSEYVFNFGKHKGKTFDWVAKNDDGYINWCVVSRVPEARPTFRDALLARGIDLPVPLAHVSNAEGAASSGVPPVPRPPAQRRR